MTLWIDALLLTLVVGVAVYLSLVHDSLLMACGAFVLGYLSGFLVYVDGGVELVHAVMIYTLVLTIGMAYLLYRKNWQVGILRSRVRTSPMLCSSSVSLLR
ncbi:MAG: hypothetical protein HC945_00930 [Nitrosarchaeum sp.]|nr:hypothetical protein [Nitrosarchaeum sp.]